MERKLRRTMWVLPIAVLAMLTGCGNAASSGGTDGISVEPRTIGLVSLGLGSPIAEAHVDIVKAAAEALGWEVLVADGAYDPAKIGAAVQSYVDRGVDAIITESSEADVMRSGLLAAQRAGIPVIATTGGVVDSDLFAAEYTEDESKMGMMGAQAIIDAVDDPTVLNLKVSAASSGVERDTALKATLPDGSIIDEHDIDLGNPIDSTQSAVDAALSKYPDINAIYAVYDTLLQPTETTMRRKSSEAKVFSYFATAANLDRLRSTDNPLFAVVAVNLAKTGAVAVDQLVAHFEDGNDIDPAAMDAEPLDYVILTKDNFESKLDGRAEMFPNSEILAPFVSRWKEAYAG